MAEANFERFRQTMDSMQFETLPLFSRPYLSWNLQTEFVGRRLVYRPETESTMDDARRMLERFRLSSGAIVLAEVQTAGRGRSDRSWISPPDVNLLYTLVLMTDSPPQRRSLAYITPLATALAIEEISEAHADSVETELKWPNDVQIGGKKVAGTLIETTQTSNGQSVALVGVGINVNQEVQRFPEIAEIATSVKDAAGAEVPRERLLASFCNHFESLLAESNSGSRGPFQAWRARLVTLGREVTASGTGSPIQGLAIDVDKNGALLIEQPDGSRVQVEAGDVTLRGSA